MDEPDLALGTRLDALLERWRDCLDLWLQTGCAAPSAAARLALDHCADDAGTGEWPHVRALADALRRAEEGSGAAALLDLLVWLETLQRLRDAERLAGGVDDG
ncbi:hypothetical protein [Thiocystis violacea]|uniref:hypothetical protein n=1 Tax=Thiocystis violacea TaxID=13725 RepID=UPI00190854D3|nr:hypothetical protein [Thiocystis violacea]MBK1721267.1 hypothetical protein [Thiocystis violacea]